MTFGCSETTGEYHFVPCRQHKMSCWSKVPEKKLVLMIRAKMTTQMNIVILQKVKIILDVIPFCVWCMLSSCSGRVM
jgi:hypothetical protein